MLEDPRDGGLTLPTVRKSAYVHLSAADWLFGDSTLHLRARSEQSTQASKLFTPGVTNGSAYVVSH
jgi:hypothetical protein